MAGVTDAAEILMLDWITVTGTPTRPSGFYLGLFTTTPTDKEAGTGGTEATGGGYARIALTMSGASGGATSNTSGAHDFVVGTNLAAGTYTGWGVWSASTDGTLLGCDDLTTSRTVSATGDTIRFAVGSIDLTLD